MATPDAHRAAAALVDVRHLPYWLDGPAPDPCPALAGRTTADLAVVGGGYTGLWTALLAKEADPGRDVVLLEARNVASEASGRNGGFCSASLTHGLRNGLDRFPAEMATLERLGRENLDGIEAAVARLRDRLLVRTDRRAHRRDRAMAGRRAARGAGAQRTGRRLGRVAGRRRGAGQGRLADLPRRRAGPDGCAMVDPARLAWGLREACLRLGVRIHENSPVRGSTAEGRRGPVRDAVRPGDGGPGRAGHRRVPAAAAPAVVVRRAGVGLRAHDRAADRGAARRRWAGPTGTASPTPGTCSTTTGSPTTGGSSGAATTPSTTSAAAPTTGSSAARRRS